MTDTYACGIQMFRPEGDLYALVGVEPGTSYHTVALKGADGKLDIDDPAVRYAWKALSDFHYHRLYEKTRSSKALYDAGFFDDGLPKLVPYYATYHSNWFTTSLMKVSNNVEWEPTNKRKAILVTTGGMAPIHNGHIAMMEEARKQVEALGFAVVGGFFAPGHDSYVGQKYGGTAAIPAADRVAMVELAVQDSDWLEVDPWACLHMPAEINFTDVVRRLDSFVMGYHHTDIEIFYVSGEDNAGFKDAMDNVIVVPRSAVSSKLAREGDHSHLNPKVAEYFVNMGKDTGNLPYLIRNEEDEAIKDFPMKGGKDELTKRRIQLQSSIRLGIAQLFKFMGHGHKVHLLPVSDQRVKAKEVIGNRKVISLDAFYEGDYELASTRYFSLSGAQFKPTYRGARCGSPSLYDQGHAIPEGKYVMVEDDTVTGGTIQTAKDMLGDNVEVEEVVILSDFAEYAGNKYYDVVDMRDFIFGSKHGGLSVIIPGDAFLHYRGRAPYVQPFVSLRSRAKIPSAAEMEISRIIWQSNLRFFRDSGITIGDCDSGFQAFAVHLGFHEKAPMEEFCKWGIERMMVNV